MSRKTVRREAFGGDEADQEPRPRTGRQSRATAGQATAHAKAGLQEALTAVVLTVGARLIEEWLRGPSPAVPPMPRPHTVLRTCGGLPQTRDRCGARYVHEEWTFCPFCQERLMEVPS